jgi:hypothetical protein
MPRKCIVGHCNSNISGSTHYTPTFTIPTKDRDRWNLWKTKIREGSNKSYLKIEIFDTVCIKHFEDRFIVKSAQQDTSDVNKKKPQRQKLSLTKDAYPSLDMITPAESIENGTLLNSKPKAKRGSSGLANLQKARMRKILRKERMKNLVDKRKQAKKHTNENVVIKPEPVIVKKKISNIGKDYFLSDRIPSEAERLLVALRMTNQLHSDLKIIKDPPSSIRDASVFPISNVLCKVESLKGLDKNPVNWTIDDVYQFLHPIINRNVAIAFRNEKIDGEGLLCVEMKDLTEYFQMTAEDSEFVYDCISQLRSEVIKRFIHNYN